MIALSRHGIYAFRVRGGKSARMPIGDVIQWLNYPGVRRGCLQREQRTTSP